MTELNDRVAIVTGSSSGIGAATARHLAALGANVVVNSSSSVEAGRAVADEIGDRAIYVQGDVTSAADRARLLEQTVAAFGRLDVLVNNAGWTTRVPHDDLDALTDEIFRRTFEVNVFATWDLTKAAIPLLAQSRDGVVVTVTSLAGLRPAGSSIAYAMTKAALNHMTRLLARAKAPIRFNAVAPGLVATPWTEDWDDAHAHVSARAPLRRSSTPEDQALAIASCVTNPYMTGAVILVDGGMSLVQ